MGGPEGWPMSEPEMACIDDLDDLVRLVADVPELLLRYSRGPVADAGRPSRDYEAGVDLPGLSVTTLREEPWWPRPAADWVARRVCKYLSLTRAGDERRPWVLTGQIVGHGPDHEPLVIDPQPIAWLGDRLIAQARRRYHERFA